MEPYRTASARPAIRPDGLFLQKINNASISYSKVSNASF